MSIDRNYVSEMDKFLAELDKQPDTDSESRQKEVIKYNNINKLRDEAQEDSEQEKLWSSF